MSRTIFFVHSLLVLLNDNDVKILPALLRRLEPIRLLLSCLTILRVAGRIVKALAFALAILAVGFVVARTVAQDTDPS